MWCKNTQKILELQFSYSIIAVDTLSTSSIAHNDGKYHSVHDEQCCDNDWRNDDICEIQTKSC